MTAYQRLAIAATSPPERECPQVASRVVRRYFASGKGYANASQAYQALARRDIGMVLHDLTNQRCDDLRRAGDFTASTEVARRIIAELFPNCDDDYCCYVDDYGNHARAFCRTAWRQWIKDRANVLRSFDGKVSDD